MATLNILWERAGVVMATGAGPRTERPGHCGGGQQQVCIIFMFNVTSLPALLKMYFGGTVLMHVEPLEYDMQRAGMRIHDRW